jgi:hypothetical protein
MEGMPHKAQPKSFIFSSWSTAFVGCRASQLYDFGRESTPTSNQHKLSCCCTFLLQSTVKGQGSSSLEPQSFLLGALS